MLRWYNPVQYISIYDYICLWLSMYMYVCVLCVSIYAYTHIIYIYIHNIIFICIHIHIHTQRHTHIYIYTYTYIYIYICIYANNYLTSKVYRIPSNFRELSSAWILALATFLRRAGRLFRRTTCRMASIFSQDMSEPEILSTKAVRL